MKKALLLVAAAWAVSSQVALAEANKFEVGVMAGRVFHSNFETDVEGQTVKSGSENGFAMTFNILDKEKPKAVLNYQIYGAYFGTDVEVRGAETTALPMDVSYLHFGGTYEFPMDSFRPYIGATVGGSYFAPKGADDSLRGSFGLAGGAKWYITDAIALNAEIRTIGSFLDSSKGAYCNGDNCALKVSGSLWWHTMVGAGVVVGF